MLKKLCAIAVKAREQRPELSFDAFLNFYKSAQESHALGEIMANKHKFHNLFPKDIFDSERNQSVAVNSFTVYCHTVFELTNQAHAYNQQGTVVICDDLFIWQMLQNRQMHNPGYAAFRAIYGLFSKSSLACLFDFLSNNLLFPNQEHLGLEFEARANEIKSVKDLLSKISSPVAEFLKNPPTTFKDFYKGLQIFLSAQAAQELAKFEILLEFIEQDHNLEWAHGLMMLSCSKPKIKWGLELALKFKPEEVVLCVTQPFNSKKQNVLNEKLQSWCNNKQLRVLTNIKPDSVVHPLLNQPYKAGKSCVEKFNHARTQATPNLNARPNSISATAFQTLMQDPYGFYARYVLGLKNLNRIWDRNSPKDFGILVHSLVEQLIVTKAVNLDEIETKFPLWHKRLQRLLDWVKNQLHDLQIKDIASEKSISQTLNLDSKKAVTVNARLDVLMKTAAGNLMVNFKTGTPPSKSDVLCGYAPQLAVEMLLARNFLQSDCQGEFWHLRGTQPSGATANIPIGQEFLENNILKIINHYLAQEAVFVACPWPNKTVAYNHYKHLERLDDC